MKRAIFLLAALTITASAAAQPAFKVGLRGGVNRATTTLADASTGAYSSVSYSGNKSAIFGWQAGAVLEMAFGKFALQPALLFSQKGEQFDAYTSVSDFVFLTRAKTSTVNRYNWLELPINAVYTVHGVQVFGGPYVAMALGGRQHGTDSRTYSFGIVGYQSDSIDERTNYGSNTPNRRFDAGINFGLGYRRGPLQVQLGYGLGFVNLHQIDSDYTVDSIHNFGEDAAYNRVLQLTGTYFFSL